jgi:hypothetical protein
MMASLTRPARDAADVWVQIQAICRDAMATGRTIATIDTDVSNRILDVRANSIVRASDNARTPDGQGAPVMRRTVEQIWRDLVDTGRATGFRNTYFAYALVAEVPGVAIDDDRRGLHIADWDLAMTPYQEGNGVGATTSNRRYWTLASNPDHYRVVEAVRDLDEDWWTTRGADIHAGDRAAIWKYKGSGNRRGILAFGEVLTDPEVRGPSDEELKYWVEPDDLAAENRVRVRYVLKPPEPLWLDLAPPDSVIRRLPVSRAQGGTAHHLTPDQWDELVALAGGWPQPDPEAQGQPVIWPDLQNQSAVTSYIAMLRAELAGESYVKADFNRKVQAATGRSRGAVEYRFENISAVLRDIGVPHILGYQPYGNYPDALRELVESFLSRDSEIPRLLEEGPAPDLPPTVQLTEVGPPMMASPGSGGRSRTTVGVDYLERQARNRDVGLKGELLIADHERAWLASGGRPDLGERVAHIPSTMGDGAGYDVGSFLLDGSPHHIEVKATRASIAAPFFLSAAEWRYALDHPGVTYSIYRVFELGPSPKFYKLTGDMNDVLDLTPVTYQARVKPPGEGSTASDYTDIPSAEEPPATGRA